MLGNEDHMTKKHAYLIYAHSNLRCLLFLLKSIDDPRNDIFIHIDRKWTDCAFDIIRRNVSFSNIYFTKKRLKVFWGHHSQILAEILLFKTAKKIKETYSYFHLMSGRDMCIKSQDYIHSFFKNEDKIFLGFSADPIWLDSLRDRLGTFRFRHPVIDTWAARLQRVLHFNRQSRKKILLGGENWCSLPDYCVDYLLKKARGFKFLTYLFGKCADEIYKQDIIGHSNLMNRVSDQGSLRLIDWERGGPWTFQYPDLLLLQNSKKLFARKFDDSNNAELLKAVLGLCGVTYYPDY